MIKFFRRIRKTLIEKENLSKYLIYAIGEIILVVIGILIALSINNWNENRKVTLEQINGMEELRNDLAKDCSVISNSITRIDRVIKMQQELKDHLNTGQKIDSSFKEHLGHVMIMTNMNFVTNGYNTLKKIGIEKLNDKNLQYLIIEYYDDDINDIILDTRHDEEEFKELWTPYLVSNFKD